MSNADPSPDAERWPSPIAEAQDTGRWLPQEVSILLVLFGIALAFELLGWIFIGQSFLVQFRSA